jgi:hypothetical protein
MKNYQKVVDYLKQIDVSVEISNFTAFLNNGETKTIYLHHNYNLEKNGLITLLHEAGHSLQPEGEYGPNHYKNVDDMEKPKEFMMYQFMNEVDAWNRGLNLANELDIEIDPKRWNQQMEEALLTYYV